MANNDLVSIITPSYNCGIFVADTIRSVLAQTYTNWEMLIVDDCSVDDTETIVKQFDDPRIRFLKNNTNSGAAVSRNRALLEAKGRWIAFLDSDDLWSPSKLERQIQFMRDNNYHFSYHEYEIIDEESNSVGITVSGPSHISRRGMYNYCWPGCLTVMYDSQVVGLVQVEDIRKNNDYALWLKVSRYSDCYLLRDCLASYRRRKGSISNQNKLELIKWHYRLFRNAEKQGILSSTFNTLCNLVFGLSKKLLYVKKSL